MDWCDSLPLVILLHLMRSFIVSSTALFPCNKRSSPGLSHWPNTVSVPASSHTLVLPGCFHCMMLKSRALSKSVPLVVGRPCTDRTVPQYLRIGKFGWKTDTIWFLLFLPFLSKFTVDFHSHLLKIQSLTTTDADRRSHTTFPSCDNHLVIFRLSFPHCMTISALSFPLLLHALRLNLPFPILASKQS